jgi:peptide/nickel transport system ATP-binding protein
MKDDSANTMTEGAKEEYIVVVKDLKKYFEAKLGFMAALRREKSVVKAVDGVSFAVRKKEIFGLAGESGCGKTTVGRCLLRLIEPTSGSVFYKGMNVTNLPESRLRLLRSKLQIIFQDPYDSINPRMNIFDVVAEGLRINRSALGGLSKEEIEAKVKRALTLVQLSPPEQFLDRFPHELSGGQRQRVAIARALVLEPDLIVADEPVSMLDVSIRAEVLNVVIDLPDYLGLSLLFITHDLSLAKHVCDRLGIMYLGKFSEVGHSDAVIERPLHPYTQALIAAIPVPDPSGRKVKIFAGGEVPSATDVPSGCNFHPRCPYAKQLCTTTEPELREVEPEHFAACHFYEEAYDNYKTKIAADTID